MAALLSFGCASTTWGTGFSESWYMSRGRANMKIGNYKAAIEAFEKVVGIDPDNREAMRSLGLAYEGQGLRDRAVEQFDRYLEKNDDDPEIAFKQAEFLDSPRYFYRRKDVQKYYRMGLRRKDDLNMRLNYARFLGRRKETSGEAIGEFEKVLAKEPRNAAAHRGLAKAFAWLGDNDQALYHGNLAIEYSRETSDMTTLRHDMMRGREPKLEGIFSFLLQPDQPYDLTGVRIGSRAKYGLTAFSTTAIEFGYERYWSAEGASGGYLSFGTEYRFDPTDRVDGMLEYHGFARAGRLTTNLFYTHDGDHITIRPGFKRELRYDSFMSLAGSSSSGTLLGAARSNLFYTQFIFDGGPLRFDVTPFLGWISAASLSPNDQSGIDLKMDGPLLKNERWEISGAFDLYLTHYGSDQSGFSPLVADPSPGGYFSPKLFLNQVPRLTVIFTPEDKYEIRVSGGPALQYVISVKTSGAFQVGGDVDASYTARLSKRLLLKLTTNFTQITDVYSRFQLGGFLVRTF
jgi:tetratricopeptide (TPR) repeat protein